MLSQKDIQKIARETVKEIYNYSLKIRKKFTTSEHHLKQFHILLDKYCQKLLLKNFDSFIWFDHWNKIKIGKGEIEVVIIANTSDGTFNFLKGGLFHASAIAILPPTEEIKLSEIIVNVVQTAYGNIFEVRKNSKATFNGKVIHSSKVKDIKNAIIAMDFNTQDKKRLITQFGKVFTQARSIRSLSCSSLEACYTAAGWFDAYIDVRNKLDISHLLTYKLILEKTGCIITDLNNNSFNDYKIYPKRKISFVIANNQILHRKILNLLYPPLPSEVIKH